MSPTRFQSDCSGSCRPENWRVARVAAFNGIKMVPQLDQCPGHHLQRAPGSGIRTATFANSSCTRIRRAGWRWSKSRWFRRAVPHPAGTSPGFGMELADLNELSKKYPSTERPGTVPNRASQAAERARAREEQVRRVTWARRKPAAGAKPGRPNRCNRHGSAAAGYVCSGTDCLRRALVFFGTHSRSAMPKATQ